MSPVRALPAVLLLLFVLVLLLVPLATADEEEAAREVWHFTNGEIERVVDVTDYPDFVREILRKRLETDGFRRVEEGGKATGSGRDLEADVRELVRQGGRFPTVEVPDEGEVPDPAHAQPDSADAEIGVPKAVLRAVDHLRALGHEGAPKEALRRARADLSVLVAEAARDERVSRADAGRLVDAVLGRLLSTAGQADDGVARPPARGRLLGADVRASEGPDGESTWFVVRVPEGSLAAAIGLERGDRVLGGNGVATATEARTRPTGVDAFPGQLTLILQRKEGQIVIWEFEFLFGIPPGGTPEGR